MRPLGYGLLHHNLLHDNLINALFLRDVIRRFKDKGWVLIDSEAAFKDPVYSVRTERITAALQDRGTRLQQGLKVGDDLRPAPGHSLDQP